MICYPNCKINLGLYITEKRDDGFHNLETIFYPIYALHDALEIQIANKLNCITSGIPLQIDQEKNIVIKAFQLLQKDFDLPPIQIYLHKTIPHGAGLGGGSANATFMLQLCNTYFNLKLTTNQLLVYCNLLGSDCAFFLENKPCYAIGRGEILNPINLNIKGYKICIVKPNIYISTAEAFKKITPKLPSINLADKIQMPIKQWKTNIANQFEEGIFNIHPSLNNIKNILFQNNAIYASMSGTGSTIFGIFNTDCNITIPNAEIFWLDL